MQGVSADAVFKFGGPDFPFVWVWCPQEFTWGDGWDEVAGNLVQHGKSELSSAVL